MINGMGMVMKFLIRCYMIDVLTHKMESGNIHNRME